MPCYVTGSEAGDLAMAEAEAHGEATKLARLLCSLCRVLDSVHAQNLMPREVRRWWEQHCEQDAVRKKALAVERRRRAKARAARKKLTKAERRLLGVT